MSRHLNDKGRAAGETTCKCVLKNMAWLVVGGGGGRCEHIFPPRHIWTTKETLRHRIVRGEKSPTSFTLYKRHIWAIWNYTYAAGLRQFSILGFEDETSSLFLALVPLFQLSISWVMVSSSRLGSQAEKLGHLCGQLPVVSLFSQTLKSQS